MIIEHDPALVELHHAVYQRSNLVKPVTGYQHGHLRLPCSQQLKKDMARLRVKVGRRLIEYQQVTVAPQCDTDQQLLFLPAGELVERLTPNLAGIQSQLCGNRQHPRRVAVADPGRKTDQLADRHLQGG